MFTNVGVNPTLVEEARRIGTHATKTAVIRAALEEYVERHRRAPKASGAVDGRRKKRR